MIRFWQGVPARSLAAALLVSCAAVGQAQAATLYDVDLPAGPLVRGRQAPALRGRFSAEDAAERLIAGSDLTVSRAGPHVLVLARKPPAPATRQPAQEVDAAAPFVTAAGVGEAIAEPPQAAPALLDEVTVTGTHIRGGRTASPVVTMDRDALARTGRTTVAEALRTLPANFGGGAADGAVSTGADRVGRNSAFGTGINLRGLGNNATLVLVNGRRLAGSGAFGDFADVSTIPTAAVARVEVLLDGASALYGSRTTNRLSASVTFRRLRVAFDWPA